MVSPAGDQRLIGGIESASADNESGNDSYWDKKWTYEEYMEELKMPVDQPDLNNPDDPRYYRKYAMNIPPPELHYFIPDRHTVVAVDVAS